MFRPLVAFIKMINTQHTYTIFTQCIKSKVLAKFRWWASRERMIIEMLDGSETGRGLARWSESIRLYIHSPGPQSAQGPDPSAFTVLPSNSIFGPHSIYHTYWQVRLRVTITIKVVTLQFCHGRCRIGGHSFFCEVVVRINLHIGDHTSCILLGQWKLIPWFPFLPACLGRPRSKFSLLSKRIIICAHDVTKHLVL